MTRIYYLLSARPNIDLEEFTAFIEQFDTAQYTNADGQPHNILQKRVSLDGLEVLYEANFVPTELTATRFKQRGAAAQNVNINAMSHAFALAPGLNRTSATYTVRVNNQPKVVVTLFACESDVDHATVEQSRIEAQAYLAANAEEWESE